jgi:hypothetical protein
MRCLIEREMDAELNEFLQMLTEGRIREGMSPKAVRHRSSY